MRELIDTFLNYLSVERGLSQNTIISYREDLNRYMDFLTSKHIDSLAEGHIGDVRAVAQIKPAKAGDRDDIAARRRPAG